MHTPSRAAPADYSKIYSTGLCVYVRQCVCVLLCKRFSVAQEKTVVHAGPESTKNWHLTGYHIWFKEATDITIARLEE